LAHPDEGSVVRQIVVDGGGPTWDWLDWSQVYPYWLIGEVDGVARGVIMASPGKPFGRAEYLCLDPSLPHRQKALLAKQLSYGAVAQCMMWGSQCVNSEIATHDTAWAKIAEKRGWVQVGTGTSYMKRCV
jgi:hypothetical protein